MSFSGTGCLPNESAGLLEWGIVRGAWCGEFGWDY